MHDRGREQTLESIQIKLCTKVFWCKFRLKFLGGKIALTVSKWWRLKYVNNDTSETAHKNNQT